MSNEWKTVAASVRGAGHTKNGAVNQDSVEVYCKDEYPVAIAVADGHGGNKYFRSATGSRIAVFSTTMALRVFYREYGWITDPRLLEKMAEMFLGDRIVESWREHVQQHMDWNPLLEEELKKLEASDGKSAVDAVKGDYYSAFGSTVQAVLITPSCVLYVALGDGDIVCMGTNGRAYRPLPGDHGPDSTETESLINTNPSRRFKIRAEASSRAQMIMLATDGYSNSYPTEDFTKIVNDYRKMIDSAGDDWAKTMSEKLPEILEYTTSRGSGDDITTAIACRIPQARPPAPVPAQAPAPASSPASTPQPVQAQAPVQVAQAPVQVTQALAKTPAYSQPTAAQGSYVKPSTPAAQPQPSAQPQAPATAPSGAPEPRPAPVLASAQPPSPAQAGAQSRARAAGAEPPKSVYRPVGSGNESGSGNGAGYCPKCGARLGGANFAYCGMCGYTDASRYSKPPAYSHHETPWFVVLLQRILYKAKQKVWR